MLGLRLLNLLSRHCSPEGLNGLSALDSELSGPCLSPGQGKTLNSHGASLYQVYKRVLVKLLLGSGGEGGGGDGVEILLQFI